MQKSFGVASLLLLAGVIAGCTASGSVGVNGTNPSASPTSGSTPANGITVNGSVVANLPGPLEIASVSGLKADTCAQEKSIKSASGPAVDLQIKNSSNATLRVFWLDGTGQRVEYDYQDPAGNKTTGLTAGSTFGRGTYVTHAWLITTAQGDCLGIYTPTTAGKATLDINKTVTISGTASAAASGGTGSAGGTGGTVTAGGTLTVENANEARIRQGISCLQAKGNKQSEAAAVQGSLNLYLAAQKQGDSTSLLIAKSYLSTAVNLLVREGC